MLESQNFFHHLDWPASDARVSGPVVWLRGWLVGKTGLNFTDVRVSCATGIHLGVFGLPRPDLAVHFNSAQSWLPAGFVIGVPLPDGRSCLSLEAMDEAGIWHALESINVTVAADGARSEGKIEHRPGGSATIFVPHHPFRGHLDDPMAQPPVHHGRIPVFGWLLHETQIVRTVFATLDGLVFNLLESGLADDALAAKMPQFPGADRARVRGGVDAPPTIISPGCLRVYATLGDGSVHLCFARRVILNPEVDTTAKLPATAAGLSGTALPDLPSGRPRRLLFIVRTLRSDDATLRALDVARHLVTSDRWSVRMVASEDGPLRDEFEATRCAVQLVDPREFFAATQPASVTSARDALGRQIWWRHLDAAVIFDPVGTWAGQLARQHGLTVFADPADSVAWFAPSPVFVFDSAGKIVAPIRGQAIQGAGVLLHAARYLAQDQTSGIAGRRIVISDVRDTTEETLFRASVAIQPSTSLSIGTQPTTAAAVVCPVFAGHPHRALLSALVAGVPVIATPSPLLTATFAGDAVHYVPAGDPRALARALVDALANSVANQRRSAAAARLANSAHSPVTQLPRWEKLLENAIQTSGRDGVRD